ncbi:hypothetical protein L7F22_047913 [Adiantum nelumboides]|nr:hypothetical protein [Adiantum nelumboides]
MRKDYMKWKQEKGKANISEQDDKKKSLVKIEEVNVTGYGSDNDFKIATGDIFLTSSYDSTFLTAKDGYAMSLRHTWSERCAIKISKWFFFIAQNVKHVPTIRKSLISTGKLDDAAYVTVFGNSAWKISKGSMIVTHGSKSGTLYTLHVLEVKNHLINVIEQPSVSLWHRRLGHMSKKGMEILSRSGYLPGFSFHNFEFCEHCVYGKQIQEPHRSKENHKDERLALVHNDLCGPMPSLWLGKQRTFVPL